MKRTTRKITTLFESLFISIRQRFGEEQLQLCNTILRQPIALSLLTTMSGITCAQWLRRKVGIEVYHKSIDGVPMCIVTQNKRNISSEKDDAWGTLCVYTLLELYRSVKAVMRCLNNYEAPPAALFFSHFNVKDMMNAFSSKNFIDNILPTLHGKTQYDKVVKDWDVIVSDNMLEGDDADLLQVYDWIVRLHLLLRQEGVGEKITLPTDIRTDVEQLGTIDKLQFAKITNRLLLPALQQFYPNGIEYEGVFVARPEQCRVNEYGFSPFVLPKYNILETPEKVVAEAPPRRTTLETDKGSVSELVRLLHIPRQKMNAHDDDFLQHGGFPELLDETKGGLGKSALRGLRAVAGDGPAHQCIARLADHFSTKLPMASETQLTSLATGRLAAMQGEYRAIRKEGEWYLTVKNENPKTKKEQ